MNKAILCLLLALGFQLSHAQIARELRADAIENKIKENKDELLARYYELSSRPELLSRGATRVYSGDNLGAIQFPVGGIGTGCIQYNGEAVPRYWQIFNNMTHDFILYSFFALRVKDKEGVKVRALQTRDAGQFPKMEAVEASSTFPFITYTFKDDLAAKVTMEVYNPFIPTNLKDSGIPAVIYQFTLENPTEEEMEISLLASQQNAVGFSQTAETFIGGNSFAERFENNIHQNPITNNSSSYYGGNVNSIASTQNAKVLYMEDSRSDSAEHFGQMALIMLDKHLAAITQAAASWTDESKLLKKFTKSGQISANEKTKPSEKGTTWTGALNIPMTLQPRETKVVNMALAWYFPNGKNGGHLDRWDNWGEGKWEGKGNQYANRWKDIRDLTTYLVNNHQDLRDKSQKFTDALYQTNLPYWLLDRLGGQLAIMKSRTFFFDKEGYVGLWEGAGATSGSCAGNCNHVWHYAQAHARLFPELGRYIREQSFDLIKPDGQLPYRQPAGSFAFDGQCGEIISAYREYLLTEDDTWFKKYYPAIKKAMNYLVTEHDPDKDGWLSDRPKHTTYDAAMSGNPSVLTSLYLTALVASEKMARVCDDAEQAEEWKTIADKSAELQDEKLWNGEYFIQLPGEKRHADYENGCHSDQLLGQWWADQVGLNNLYPDYKIKSATEAVAKYNFKSVLGDYIHHAWRKFALPEEAGVVATTWPGNDRTPYAIRYSDEVWTTFEYTIGATLLKYGNIRDAMTLLRSGYDRYDGKLRIGYESQGKWGNFGFSGNPFGDDECGQFYGRALSQWSVLLAAQGFAYNGPEKSIGFDPKWRPDNHRSFFSAAEGWGTFSQKQSGTKQENILSIAYGTVDLSKVSLYTGSSNRLSAKMMVNGEKVAIKVEGSANRYDILWPGTSLKAGDTLSITIE
ncbi:MAG: hypothetical protein MI975_20670 [Cytophagales bacterium]|nr:hypothetical protein [Cytophagales bacterium]